jgi:hypothetical protein
MKEFFVCHANPLISSFSLDHIRKHDEQFQTLWAKSVEKIQVPCMTVEELLQKHDMDYADVLHVDAEGYDGAILRSIDWSRLRPQSVYFEHMHLSQEEREACVHMLQSHGYSVIDANPWNTLAQLPGCVLHHG